MCKGLGFGRGYSDSLGDAGFEFLGVLAASLAALWLMVNGSFPERSEVFLQLAAAVFNPRLAPFVLVSGVVSVLAANQIRAHRSCLRWLGSFFLGLGWGLVAIPVALGAISLLSAAFLAVLEIKLLVIFEAVALASLLAVLVWLAKFRRADLKNPCEPHRDWRNLKW